MSGRNSHGSNIVPPTLSTLSARPKDDKKTKRSLTKMIRTCACFFLPISPSVNGVTIPLPEQDSSIQTCYVSASCSGYLFIWTSKTSPSWNPGLPPNEGVPYTKNLIVIPFVMGPQTLPLLYTTTFGRVNVAASSTFTSFTPLSAQEQVCVFFNVES